MVDLIAETAHDALELGEIDDVPAFLVERRPGHDNVTEEELIQFCRENLARYKIPRTVVFCELPKTTSAPMSPGGVISASASRSVPTATSAPAASRSTAG